MRRQHTAAHNAATNGRSFRSEVQESMAEAAYCDVTATDHQDHVRRHSEPADSGLRFVHHQSEKCRTLSASFQVRRLVVCYLTMWHCY